MPIIQNGDSVMKTAASPLGTHCSAKTRQPVPVPMMMTPCSAVYQSSRPCGRCAPEKIGDGQQDRAGDGVAQPHQHLRRHGFERNANAKVSGAPEETHRDQRQVGLKMRMAPQNSG
jgi:methylphosphotriester-DNA--protein-cysteine methyltransferase